MFDDRLFCHRHEDVELYYISVGELPGVEIIENFWELR
jgi:hypothetical protein